MADRVRCYPRENLQRKLRDLANQFEYIKKDYHVDVDVQYRYDDDDLCHQQLKGLYLRNNTYVRGPFVSIELYPLSNDTGFIMYVLTRTDCVYSWVIPYSDDPNFNRQVRENLDALLYQWFNGIWRGNIGTTDSNWARLFEFVTNSTQDACMDICVR